MEEIPCGFCFLEFKSNCLQKVSKIATSSFFIEEFWNEHTEKYMSKKNKTKNKQNISSVTEKTIDEKLLAREIVKAFEEVERDKNVEKEKQKKKEHKEWLKFLNQKEYPLNEKWFLRKYHAFRNDFCVQ